VHILRWYTATDLTFISIGTSSKGGVACSRNKDREADGPTG